MSKPNPQMNPPKRKLDIGALGRVIKLLFGYYPVLLPITVVCILFAAVVASIPALFIQRILASIESWYVTSDWAAASKEIVPLIITLAVIYVVSLTAITVYTQLMAYITQGFLSKLRVRMFEGMQNLPIRYFDTNKHGDIMSHYTNDIDTLRQLVSQSLPAIIQSTVIVSVVFCIMLWYSIPMTLLLIVGVVAMMLVSKKIGGGSAKYFIRQQQAVGKTEGFVQEMMNGQKVIKVFCHENQSNEDFDKINNELYEDSYRAHAYANALGPIIMNIGNVLYVLMATLGALFIISGVPNFSISGMVFGISILVPFLNMTKQFTGNINTVTQQFNSIVMALAGAKRIFELMDAEPEAD